jgi:hypothetical protein
MPGISARGQPHPAPDGIHPRAAAIGVNSMSMARISVIVCRSMRPWSLGLDQRFISNPRRGDRCWQLIFAGVRGPTFL